MGKNKAEVRSDISLPAEVVEYFTELDGGVNSSKRRILSERLKYIYNNDPDRPGKFPKVSCRLP